MEHHVLQRELRVDVLAQLAGGCFEAHQERVDVYERIMRRRPLELLAAIDVDDRYGTAARDQLKAMFSSALNWWYAQPSSLYRRQVGFAQKPVSTAIPTRCHLQKAPGAARLLQDSCATADTG